MIVVTAAEARAILLRGTALDRPAFPSGLAGAGAVLGRLGCVQLDPLDRVGTNADLVLHARVDGIRRGDWAAALPGGAFEHFAKERCLLPARLFPFYRDRALETPWWRLSERLKRLDPAVIGAVLAEVQARGPLPATALSDQGQVEPLDWSGWKGTSKAASMAIEVLWTRTQVVTCGRSPGGARLYDVPARALPEWFDAPGGDLEQALLWERLRGAGLLSTAGGPHWSMLSHLRGSPRLAGWLASGALVELRLSGSRRAWLCLPETLEAATAEPDDRMRVLGPLDPLLWDRALVKLAFDFDYVWEVYKPAAQRQWGYYVTPLLYRGALVGRMEARRVRSADGGFAIDVVQRWGNLPAGPFDEAIDRLRQMQAA